MKHKLILLLSVVILAACSAPKYSYNFGHHDYSVKKQKGKTTEVSPLAVNPELLVASAEPMIVSEPSNDGGTVVKKTYMQMTKSERKALRHHLKKEVKAFVASKKKANSIQATQAGMDSDLRLAILFGAVGVVGILIGGDVFSIIGGIALLIGVVFFVKWVIRQ